MPITLFAPALPVKAAMKSRITYSPNGLLVARYHTDMGYIKGYIKRIRAKERRREDFQWFELIKQWAKSKIVHDLRFIETLPEPAISMTTRLAAARQPKPTIKP